MFYNIVREHNDLFSEQRLWLPCYEDGDIVGHIGASLDPENVQPKYLNAEGGWALSHFFMWDQALKLSRRLLKRGEIKKRYACVVEGPADALLMYQEEIPTVGVLGTNNWTEAKANMLSVTYDFVFTIGDGDSAGRKMNKEVKRMLRPIMGDEFVRAIKLEDGDDPAKLKRRQIRELKRIIAKYTT
jgi:DNA primase